MSCTDIRIDGSILSANCRRPGGSYEPSSLDLNSCVGNKNGIITWGSSDFYYTAREVRLGWYDGRPQLLAQLRNNHGYWGPDVDLELDQRIENKNGKLVYQ